MKGRSPSSWTPTKRFKPPSHPREEQPWTREMVLRELRRLGEARNVEGMARFRIRAKAVYGVAKPQLDALARHIGRNRKLALELWESGVHDARILAGMIDVASQVSAQQMENWARCFDNWDVCDGTCCHLFVFAAPAWRKAAVWSGRKEEFIKRAGFALMAYLAYRDKSASNGKFLHLLPIIERQAWDHRNFVRKAVNWALRNIGKRNRLLNRAAIQCAERIRQQGSRAARWIAADALRELQSPAVEARLRRKVHDDAVSSVLLSSVKIRRARRSDAQRLAELSGELGYPATREEMEKRLARMQPARQHAVFVAETHIQGQKREVIGWLHVSVSHLLEVDTRAEVNGLVVGEARRSQGAGARLLEAAEIWARQRGCRSMSVRSNVIRERAHLFYLRQGYEHYKTQKAFRKDL